MLTHDHYYHGAWIQGEGPSLESENPCTGLPCFQTKHATPQEVQAAVHSAELAFESWRHTSFETRQIYLQRFTDCLRKNQSILVQLISLETGKPYWEAQTEVQSALSKIDWAIQAYQTRTHAYSQYQDETLELGVRFKPLGVVAVIGPFNFPLHLSHAQIIPALLAGNTVVYKPSELTPYVAHAMMMCFHEAMLPQGVLNLIQGNAQTAQYLLTQPIQAVLFTGSYSAGSAIHAAMINRPDVLLALEMGGHNPLIIEPVQSITAARYHTLLSCFITAGQRCSSAKRLMIPDHAWGDDFLTTLLKDTEALRIGPPEDQPEPFMGPVIRRHHAERQLSLQQQYLDAGGQALKSMAYLDPALSFLTPGFIDMTHASTLIDQEMFGPCVQVYRYHDFEEALHYANQTQYGLTAGLITDNIDHYERFTHEVVAGVHTLNRATTGVPSQLPFGGIKHSGNHRPSGYFAADYCVYPVSYLKNTSLQTPEALLPGIFLNP